jgi:hypothetical protein
MKLTVGRLKEIMNEVPDDALVSALLYGDEIHEFDYLKRVLLLEREDQKILLINPMGTHYFDLVEKEGWKILQWFDKD